MIKWKMNRIENLIMYKSKENPNSVLTLWRTRLWFDMIKPELTSATSGLPCRTQGFNIQMYGKIHLIRMYLQEIKIKNLAQFCCTRGLICSGNNMVANGDCSR